ncbi:Peroxin 13, N-terminal region-domain-containing protein [Boletus coccyginus]|nr:Peroxin 13, N-terminal region-domain-containing protein [Boletus coccyginus]
MASPLKPWEQMSLPPMSTVQTEPPSLPTCPEFLSPSHTTASPPYHNHSPYSPFILYRGGLGYGGMGRYGYSRYGVNGLYAEIPGMGMGGMGMYPGIDPNNPSLTQALETTTQHTFSLLHSIVQTFSGVAQMLESTFMYGHSQLILRNGHHLRNALGSVLGLFRLMRWMKELITGKPSSPMQGEFKAFINSRPGQVGAQLGPLDPSTLLFARALYSFTPSLPSELTLKEDEIVAIMGKLDPITGMEVDPQLEVESEWWRGRTCDGRKGWFPKKWVEILACRKPVEDLEKID